MIFILAENNKLQITKYTISSTKIPKPFDHSKFILLTDLHNHVFGNNHSFLIQKIDQIQPDYILIAGDMITSRSDFDGYEVYQLLKQLSSRYKIYYGVGNHESRLSQNPETRDAFNAFVKKLEALEIPYLNNLSVELYRNNEKIVINGLELGLSYYKKCRSDQIDQSELNHLLGPCNTNDYHILLAHNPIYFSGYEKWGADLVLSGHVHGGIVIIPGIGGVLSTQFRLFPQYDYGKFDLQKASMILSRGLGGHTINVRIFNRPELIVLNLQRKP